MGDMLGYYFKKGAEVEISSDDEAFRGSWYVGVVIRAMSKKNSTIIVVCKSLMADEEGLEPLRELVDLVQLRPPPPLELGRGFKFSEEVDVFHNDGLWEGVVTEVLDGGRCSIFFRGSREQMDFTATDLRLHREWVTGKWVLPLEKSDLDKIRPDYGANLVICTHDELFSISIPCQAFAHKVYIMKVNHDGSVARLEEERSGEQGKEVKSVVVLKSMVAAVEEDGVEADLGKMKVTIFFYTQNILNKDS
ncbi:protein AGENET DOMAIN (AGD)-CONTAINING P1-like [Malania oleifera]|uniref:protein AGENET DOMAIN (AGD)-CONTAINING P1-like n=1 Tax=Malania oleifera TaxID=397392 RepID=UPI0025ADC8E4|nr:protein AGENET DOMAIN (AGD)-CONTAINING P1-like [Malania oleifera]